jgi:hypothetical protein
VLDALHRNDPKSMVGSGKVSLPLFSADVSLFAAGAPPSPRCEHVVAGSI